MSILRNCCCCISLRNGGVILGVLTLIGGLVWLAISSVSLYSTFPSDQLDQFIRDQNKSHEYTDTELDTIRNETRLWLGLHIAVLTLSVICSLFLIYGALGVSITARSWLMGLPTHRDVKIVAIFTSLLHLPNEELMDRPTDHHIVSFAASEEILDPLPRQRWCPMRLRGCVADLPYLPCSCRRGRGHAGSYD